MIQLRLPTSDCLNQIARILSRIESRISCISRYDAVQRKREAGSWTNRCREHRIPGSLPASQESTVGHCHNCQRNETRSLLWTSLARDREITRAWQLRQKQKHYDDPSSPSLFQQHRQGAIYISHKKAIEQAFR